MDLDSVVGKFKAGDGENAPDALLEYVQQVHNFFSGGPDPSKLDYYLGLACPEPDGMEGLLSFLRRKITMKEFIKVKEQIFNLLHFVLVQKAWRSDVNRFIIRFKVVADMYWRNTKESARLQQAALDCLIFLCVNFEESINADLEDFEFGTLYWSLLSSSESSKYQPTVRGKMFHLLGILSNFGKETFMSQRNANPSTQLFRHFTATVNSQVVGSDAHLEVSILLGCMKGLERFLNAYGVELPTGDNAWVQFQDQLEQIVNPATSIKKEGGVAKIKRREFQRAALELVASHSQQFETGLILKYRQWYEDLMAWSKSSNGDDNKIGRKAMYKFLDTVIEHSKQPRDDPGWSRRLKQFFKFFSDKFEAILKTKDANRIELGIAVKGFGMLSNLCTEENKSQEMLDLIIQHINSIIHELDSPNVDKYSGVIAVLPTYLESVASIIPSINYDEITGVSKFKDQDLDSIRKLVVLLVRFYPDLHENQRNFCYISVQKLIDSLWHHHHLLCEPFVEQVYQQSLLQIVSCPTKAEIDILVEAWTKTNPGSKKSPLNQLGIKPVGWYVQFWRLLLSRGQSDSDSLQFDLLMRWILTTIDKLDLSITFENTDSSDYALDTVEGATAAVVKDFQIFINIVDFFQAFMSSEDQVLQKRFEKWIPTFSQEMLSCIKTHAYVSGFYKILAIVLRSARNVQFFDDEETGESKELIIKLNIFFKGLGTKIREFRDDLLFAVLELWLALPDSLILTNFDALNHTLRTVFTVGRSSLSLAMKGLEAVQRWFFQPKFPVDDITVILNSIFPILKTYFTQSETSQLDEDGSKSKTESSRKGNLKELVKKNVQTKKSRDDDVTLRATQLQILRVFGSFGQFLQLEDKQHSGLSNKRDKYLKYTIPFKDCKPDFFIDDLLSRVLDLCENAVDRQTRISACEFFHTLSLLFIGKSMEHAAEKAKLFRQIFQSMLKLGCDSDIVVRQLFNPLCLQTIHWFSKPNSPFGTDLMEVLTENLTQSEDLSLRELAAMCTGEFFQWSLRQDPNSDSSDDKAKGVLKTIFALSTHASPNCRQGSVLAFNSIYKEFRENRRMVSEYTFNLLYSFLASLKLSGDLPEDSLLITSTKQSIRHLERILIKKKDQFNTALTRQFKPLIKDKPCLRDVVQWLLIQGGSDAAAFREECLRLTSVLAQHVKDVGSTERCLALWEEQNKGPECWTSIAEVKVAETLVNQIVFLDASSSFYNFLDTNEMLPRNMFLPTSRSKFCNVLTNICALSSSMPDQVLKEDQKLSLLKIFSRLKFGWKIFDADCLTKIWKYSMELCKETVHLLSSDVIQSLLDAWNVGTFSPSMISACHSLIFFEPDNIPNLNDDQISSVLNHSTWYRAIAEGGLMSTVLTNTDKEILKMQLWDSVTQALFKQTQKSQATQNTEWKANDLKPNEKKIAENYLITALHLGLDHTFVVEATFDATNIFHKDGSFQLVTTKGRIFQRELINALVYCDSLFNFETLVQEKKIGDVGDLIQKFLELMKASRVLRKKFGEIVFKQAITKWKLISNNAEIPTTIRIFVGLLAVDIDACRNSVELANWWRESLMDARHLDLKQKAEVIGYASIFALSRNKNIVGSVTTSISVFVEKNLVPSKDTWGEVKQYVIHIIRKIMKVFEHLNLNLELLNPILSTVQKVSIWLKDVKDHPIFHLVRESLEKVVKVQYPADPERIALASKLYELITSGNEEGRLFVESVPVWTYCLIPVVSSLSQNASKSFFRTHIYDIIIKSEAKPTTKYDWLLKTLEIQLLELLVYQTSAEFMKSIEIAVSYISKASKKEKEDWDSKPDEKDRIVYRKITGSCCRALREILPNDDSLGKCNLSCNEACYNTLAATLLHIKPEFRFFDSFLFPGKRVFENFVDTDVAYEFPVMVDETKHKEGVVWNMKKSKESANFREDGFMNFMPASGNLTGSSLAPEATSYDFTTSVTVANSEFYQRIFGNQSGDGAGGALTNQNVIKLEWNEINQHGCMFSYVEVLKQMAEFHKNKADIGKDPKSGADLLQWPIRVAKILGDRQVHKNIKTFIVGGIINTPESVEPFAAALTEPIIQLILSDCFGSVGLNHFVQDVIITLLSWNKIADAKPTPASVTSLLKYFIENIKKNEEISKRRDVRNHIMELLKNVVEHWVQEGSVIPSQEIMALATKDMTEEECILMLNICYSVLLGGQLPGEVPRIMNKFIAGCKNRYKVVYVTASRCIGLLLKEIKEKASSALHDHLKAITKNLNEVSRSKPSVFVEILTGIQQHFPEIMNQFRDSIMGLCHVPRLRSVLLSLMPLLLAQLVNEPPKDDTILSISPQRSAANDFFVDIDGRGFFQTLCKTDGELKAGLDLMDLLVENCSFGENLLKRFDWVKLAESRAHLKVQYANCLTKLYTKVVDESRLQDKHLDPEKESVILQTFVRMYEDEDEAVQEAVSKFWTNALADPAQPDKSTADILLDLFELICQEEHPLNVCLGLILKRCSVSPDYSKKIFERPLEECNFAPFQLDTSWRLRHSSFQPLFSESLSTSKNFSALPRTLQSSLLSQRRTVGKYGMNMLRATMANLQFTPTQQQEFDDTVEERRMEIDEYDHFNFDSIYDPIMRPATTSTGSGGNNSVPTSTGSGVSESSRNPILKLRRKFYTRKDTTYYAARVVETIAEKQEVARELKMSRQAGVKTVRSYRIGELPDIIISHSDILNTLLKLTRQDSTLGQQFLTHLYVGLKREMDRSASHKFMRKSKEVFNKVLQNSLQHPDRAFLTLLMELSVSNAIPIQINVVLDVCKVANLQKLGILKFEAELLDEAESSMVQPQSKRPRVALPPPWSSEREEVWLGLAEMYREVEEYDVLRNIFVSIHNAIVDETDARKSIYENVGHALHLEGQGKLDEALKIFDESLDRDKEGESYSRTMKMFLEDATMHCLSKLGEWSNLYALSSIKFPTVSQNRFIHDANTIDRLIPAQMLSGLQLTLRDVDDDENEDIVPDRRSTKIHAEMKTNLQSFRSFMEETLSSEEGTGFLTARYPYEVGAWLLDENEADYFPLATLMLERGSEVMLRNLREMDTLPLKVQRQLIVSLQQSSVLVDYLTWKKLTQNKDALEKQTKLVLGNWKKCFENQPMNLIGNDFIAAHRDRFATKIGLSLQDLNACDSLLMFVQEFRVDQDLWLGNLGVYHKNLATSHQAIYRLKTTGRDDLRRVEFHKTVARFLATFHYLLQTNDWSKRWCGVWKKLNKFPESSDINDVKADLLFSLTELSTREGQTLNSDIFIKALQGNPTNGDTLSSCIQNATEAMIHRCDQEQFTPKNVSLYSKLFHLLKSLGSVLPNPSVELGQQLLRCLLRGCCDGDAKEILLLSNIFLILEQFPALDKSFGEMVASVPSYMFLPWIDQLMTTYKHAAATYSSFKSVLDRLAADFPQAFQLQYLEYLNESGRVFTSALKAVVLPHKLHESIILKIRDSKSEEKLMSHLLEFQTNLQEIINNNNKIYGEYHTDFATDMFDSVNHIITHNQKSSGSSLASSPGGNEGLSSMSTQYKQKILELFQNQKERKDLRLGRILRLEKLSPFLAEFHFFQYDSFEKPGLYENFKRPRAHDNPMIVSFHPTVTLYTSLTRPIRFTVITNDGKRSNFLAKLGDDLRQDRRIQQLFKMSNVLFQRDTEIKKRNVSIDTYSCIPITEDFGIIEMVDNVMSLAEMVFDAPERTLVRQKMIEKYTMWVRSNCDPQSNNRFYEHYTSCARKVDRKTAENCFKEISSMLPKSLLRNNLRQRSANFLEFFSIRQNLIKNYGALCMVHWLIGIGDRHLENMLVSMKEGKIVGIDFGRAFGTANSIIQIPEMVPFRLTPQIQYLMMPYTHTGLFRESCILSWNCLVEASDIILAVADVFIKEPSIDWLKLRKGSKSGNSEDSEVGSRNSTPSQAQGEFVPFEIMKRKLKSHNPTQILLEELKMNNHRNVPAVYSTIAAESRMHMEKDIVTSEEYIDILLNLATDENILCRVFAGWNPWV